MEKNRYFGTNSGCYFGNVCSTFVSYCLGLTKAWDTNTYSLFAKKGIFKALLDKTSKCLEVGDVIWCNGHGRVVTGLKSNASGITEVEISEADGICKITKWYTAGQVNDYMDKLKCITYRCNDLNLKNDYEPETISAINNDICTFAGNYASFAEGEDIFINYDNKSTYTRAMLFKDDSLIGEIPLDRSDPDLFHNIILYNESTGQYEKSGIYAINLSNIGGAKRKIISDSYLVDMNNIEECILNEAPNNCIFNHIPGRSLVHGKYKMCLSDGSSNSAFTYFEVIDAKVKLNSINTKTGSEYNISFSSSGGGPIYVDMINQVLDGSCVYVFNREEIETGIAMFNPDELGLEQIRWNPLKNNVNNSIRVFFQGDYGRIAREIMPVISKNKDGKYVIDSVHVIII